MCVCVYVYILIDIDLDQGRSRERERGFIRKQCQYMTINLPRLLSTAVHITEGTHYAGLPGCGTVKRALFVLQNKSICHIKAPDFALGAALTCPGRAWEQP